MSWEAYVTTSLVGSGCLDKGAIFSVDGSAVWAASKDFKISAEEAKHIATLFADSGKAFGEGFRLEGTKYVTIKAEGRSLYGKQGKTGVCVVKTAQAMLVGHFNEEKDGNQNAGNAAKVVEGLADYLGTVGF